MIDMAGGEGGWVDIATHVLSILAGIFGYKKYTERKASSPNGELTKLFIEFSACVREQHRQHEDELVKMATVLERKAEIMARITEMLAVMQRSIERMEARNEAR